MTSRNFLSSSHRTYSLWKEVKPICYSIIRGKRAPLSFKIVLQFSPNKAAALLQNSSLSFPPEQVAGLYLNLQYKNKTLLCTTGTSLKTFFPGKELDHLWEQYVTEFSVIMRFPLRAYSLSSPHPFPDKMRSCLRIHCSLVCIPEDIRRSVPAFPDDFPTYIYNSTDIMLYIGWLDLNFFASLG